MDDGRNAGCPDRRPKKGCLFSIAFNEMNLCPSLPGERASDWHSWETTARTQISPHPGLRGQIQELERISNMASPQVWERRRRHKINFALPAQQGVYEGIEPRFRFT